MLGIGAGTGATATAGIQGEVGVNLEKLKSGSVSLEQREDALNRTFDWQLVGR
jgi:hypothetical protein